MFNGLRKIALTAASALTCATAWTAFAADTPQTNVGLCDKEVSSLKGSARAAYIRRCQRDDQLENGANNTKREQDSYLIEKRDPCDDDRGDAILRCSEKRLAEAKKELDSTLTSLREEIHAGQIKSLDYSQKLWLRYVKSFCAVAADPMLSQPNNTSTQIYWGIAMENYCNMRLTVERTGNLSRVLACIRHGGSECS